MFKFQAKYLPMLAPFMAKNDIRYYLNGINVRPWGKGVLLAATCGHTLGLVYDDKGKADGEYTVQVSPALVAAARRPKWPNGSTVRGDAWVQAQALPDIERQPTQLHKEFQPMKCARLSLVAGTDGMHGVEAELHLQAGNCLIDGRYPDVQRVVPVREHIKPGAPDAYQVQYFDRLPRTNKSRSWCSGVRFYYDSRGREHAGAMTVLICHLPDIPEFMALIMPLRVDKASNWIDGSPTWWGAAA